MPKGKCFIDKKTCIEKCVLYRKGIRYREDNTTPVPFEECAFNIMADCLENLVGRMVGLQKENNKVANSMDNLSKLFVGRLTQMREENDNYPALPEGR